MISSYPSSIHKVFRISNCSSKSSCSFFDSSYLKASFLTRSAREYILPSGYRLAVRRRNGIMASSSYCGHNNPLAH